MVQQFLENIAHLVARVQVGLWRNAVHCTLVGDCDQLPIGMRSNTSKWPSVRDITAASLCPRPPTCVSACRAARLCHAVAHGGQIAVPLDIAQQFVEHCTGAPGALTEEGLSSTPRTPHALPEVPDEPDEMLTEMHDNPLCEGSERRTSRVSGGHAAACSGLVLRVSRLSNRSATASSDVSWPHGSSQLSPLMRGAFPLCPCALTAGMSCSPRVRVGSITGSLA